MSDSFAATDSVAVDFLWGGVDAVAVTDSVAVEQALILGEADTIEVVDSVEVEISEYHVRSITDAELDLRDSIVVELNAVEVVATELKPTVRLLVG